jgi:dTDP-glucose 4,6-dehydratase
MMESIVVTGGLGFIGSNFIHHIIATRHDVRITNVDYQGIGSNPASVRDLSKNGRYRFIKADLADPKALDATLKGADAVVNFAAETHVDRSIANPQPFLHSNLVASFNLLEGCRKNKVGKLVQISTDEVYGSIASGSFSEESRLNPSSPYSSTKAATDLMATAWNNTYKVPTVVLRCTNNFGPYQHPEKFIPKIIIRSIRGLDIPLYGGGGHVRDWIYVRDFCTAIEAALDKGKPGNIYNVSAGNEFSNREVAERVLKHLGKPADKIVSVEDRPGHDVRYSLSSEKASRQLGWRPRHDFDDALVLTTKWYLSNQDWWKPLATDKVLSPTPWKERW